MHTNWNCNYPEIARESGFKLQQFIEGQPDWSIISSINVDKIIRTQNFEQVDKLSSHLSEVPLVSLLNNSILDSNVSKYFGLAQLTIQYLDFCKRFLDETVMSLREAIQGIRSENVILKKEHSEKTSEILKLHKKLQRIEEINEVLYPCSMCTKNFISNEMLNTHLARKHSSQKQSDTKNTEVTDRTLINTIKLELEVKHLKERLNATEKEMRENNTQLLNMNSPSKPDIGSGKINQRNNSIGTQTDLKSSTIGVQTNLEDDKEVDDIICNEISNNAQILNEIREKFLEFDEWKNKQLQTNKSSFLEIKNNLNEIVETIEKGDKEKIEMQDILKRTIQSIDASYADKVNQMLERIEFNYKEKLHSFQSELKQFVHNNEIIKEKPRNVLKNLNVTPPTIIEVEEISSKSSDDFKRISRDEKSTETDKQYTATSLQKLSVSSIVHSEIIQISSEDETGSSDESNHFAFPSSNKRKLIQTKENQDRKPQNKQLSKSSMAAIKRADAKKMFNKKLIELGVNANTTQLTEIKTNHVLALLKEERNRSKTKYPKFFNTRNSIRNLLSKLAKNKLTPKSLNAISTNGNHFGNNLDGDSMNQVITKPDASLVDCNEDEKDVANAAANKGSAVTLYESTDKQKMSDSKVRLERILSSPVQKPHSIHILNSNSSKNEFKIVEVQSNPTKPVPVPRKKVMFDLSTGKKSVEISNNK